MRLLFLFHRSAISDMQYRRQQRVSAACLSTLLLNAARTRNLCQSASTLAHTVQSSQLRCVLREWHYHSRSRCHALEISNLLFAAYLLTLLERTFAAWLALSRRLQLARQAAQHLACSIKAGLAKQALMALHRAAASAHQRREAAILLQQRCTQRMMSRAFHALMLHQGGHDKASIISCSGSSESDMALQPPVSVQISTGRLGRTAADWQSLGGARPHGMHTALAHRCKTILHGWRLVAVCSRRRRWAEQTLQRACARRATRACFTAWRNRTLHDRLLELQAVALATDAHMTRCLTHWRALARGRAWLESKVQTLLASTAHAMQRRAMSALREYIGRRRQKQIVSQMACVHYQVVRLALVVHMWRQEVIQIRILRVASLQVTHQRVTRICASVVSGWARWTSVSREAHRRAASISSALLRGALAALRQHALRRGHLHRASAVLVGLTVQKLLRTAWQGWAGVAAVRGLDVRGALGRHTAFAATVPGANRLTFTSYLAHHQHSGMIVLLYGRMIARWLRRLLQSWRALIQERQRQLSLCNTHLRRKRRARLMLCLRFLHGEVAQCQARTALALAHHSRFLLGSLRAFTHAWRTAALHGRQQRREICRFHRATALRVKRSILHQWRAAAARSMSLTAGLGCYLRQLRADLCRDVLSGWWHRTLELRDARSGAVLLLRRIQCRVSVTGAGKSLNIISVICASHLLEGSVTGCNICLARVLLRDTSIERGCHYLHRVMCSSLPS